MRDSLTQLKDTNVKVCVKEHRIRPYALIASFFAHSFLAFACNTIGLIDVRKSFLNDDYQNKSKPPFPIPH